MHCTTLYFVLLEVPIPRNWIFTSWRSQPGSHDFGDIVTSAPLSNKSSMAMPLIGIFSFDLWSFIEICQNTCFLISPEMRSMILATGIKSFNYSVEAFPMLTGHDWTKFDTGSVKGPLRHYLMAKGYLACPCCSTFISPMLVFATPSAYFRRLGPSVWVISRKKITFLVCRNVLSTTPFQMTLFTTIKASKLLIFLSF